MTHPMDPYSPMKSGGPSFDQRIRDAKTILQANWPPMQQPLPDDVQDTVATIMVIYAIQIELEYLSL